MPIVKHGAQQSKRQKTASVNQKKQLDIALDDDTAFFGRVIKINMARCTVNLWDHEKKRHIEVQARLPNKKKGFIKMNDLVNLAKSNPDWEVQISLDAKAANQLRKAGRISAELATEIAAASGGAPSTEDLGIEFDYEGVETAGDIDDSMAPLKLKESKVDDDFDVDAI
jgi:hypothetical protein